MTEQDWLNSTDPQAMLAFLRTSSSPGTRKLRLFASACVRRVWHLLRDDRSRRAVEVAESYADGLATLDELRAASYAAIEATWAVKAEQDAAWPDEPTDGVLAAAEAAETVAFPLSDGGVWGSDDGDGAWEAAALAIGDEAFAQEQARQAKLLRDIFGNPFKPFAVELAWRTPVVISFARTVYDDRLLPSGHLDPARLAEVAAALEAAGCTDVELLGQLRGPGPQVRGCWAVDLILSKE